MPIYPRLSALCLALALNAPLSVLSQTTTTSGDCSNAFVQVTVQGNFTINTQCGLSPHVVEDLRKQLVRIQTELKLTRAQTQTWAMATNTLLSVRMQGVESELKVNSSRLAQVLAILEQKQKADPALDVAQEAAKWEQRYKELLKDWNIVSGDDPRDKEVLEALERFDLDKAGRLLDALIEAQGKTEKVLAARQWQRAQVYLLQFDRLKALPHLRKAFALAADNTDYGIQLGKALQEQHDYLGAEPVYRELVSHLRALARDNPAAYRPNLATSLNNLGLLYADTQRFKEAEAAHAEAVDIRRTLARDNPAAYRPNLATSLNNLGLLYANTQRFKEAEAAHAEAVDIRRTLARDNPAAYRPDLANSLNNLGGLYFRTQRLKEAETPFAEAVSLQRALYQTYPAAHGPNLKVFLSNLAELYAKQNRPNDQAALETEIAAVDKKLAQSTTK